MNESVAGAQCIFPCRCASDFGRVKFDPMIDASQCAQLLRCSKEQVERLADDGRLPAVKFGRGWIFVTTQVLAYVESLCEANLKVPDKSGGEHPPKARAAQGTRLGPVVHGGPVRGRGRPRQPTPL